METLEQKKANRLRYLHRLYAVTEGDSHKIVEAEAVGAELGFDRERSLAITQYLAGEGLLKYQTFGPTVSITHHGIVQVERALSEPERPTQYFPPAIHIIHVGSMVNSQIQQASHHSAQTLQIDQSSTAAIRDFVEVFRQRMPEMRLTPAVESEAGAEMTTIEAQLLSPRPKPGILRESLLSLRTILEEAAGSVVASDLLPKLAQILALLGNAG